MSRLSTPSTVRRMPRTSGRPAQWTVALVAMLLAAAGCGGDSQGSTPTDGSNGAPAAQTLTVSAAASLTEVFTAIARDFEASEAGVRVRLNLGGSAALAQQVVAGAPADVFASASPATMKTVVDAGQADGTPVVFARNVLELAVPRANPAGIRTFADLGRPGVKLAVCAPSVPCGASAVQVLSAVPGTQPVTREQDVKAVLTKVVLGEVDAGLVYATDVRAAGDKVTGVAVPGAAAAANDYLITALEGAADPTLARRFVQHVTGAESRRALQDAGFQFP